MAREMKDSGSKWIGMIPNDWDTIPVKRCFKIENGSDPVTKEGPVPVYGSGAQSFKTCVEYKEGPTVLLGRKGTINIPRWVNGKYWNVDTAFNVKSISDYDMRLFYYAATCFDYDTYSTQTALPSMTQSEYESIKLPLVSNAKEIVDLLDNSCNKITDAISRHQSIIEKLEEYKKSIITQVVTKGLNPDVKMEDSEIEWLGKVPQNWDVVKNKHVFTIKKDIAREEGHTVLSITQRGIVPKNLETNEGQLAASYANYQLVNVGDFAMNHMDLLTGWVDISKYEGVTSPDYRVFYVTDSDKHYAPYYLYIMQLCYFNRIFYGLGAGVSGFGRWRLQAPEFLNFKVPVPPIEEQMEITNYLDDKCLKIADAIARQKAAIEKLEEYKKSLIYNAVTGKLDCREGSFDEA